MPAVNQKLYIGNTSKQNVDFTYRLPDEKARKNHAVTADGQVILERNYRVEKIPMGTQILVGGGKLSSEQIGIILDQYEDKGLRDVTKLSNLQEYVGLCYRLDKPIDLEKLNFVIEQNDDRLNDRAEDRQEAVAAAVAQSLATRNAELGTPLARTEIETVEDTRGQARLARGFEISHDGRSPRRGDRPGPRARRRTNA